MPTHAHTRNKQRASRLSAWLLVLILVLFGAGCSSGGHDHQFKGSKHSKTIELGPFYSNPCEPECYYVEFEAESAFYKVKIKSKYVSSAIIKLNGDTIFSGKDFKKHKNPKATVWLEDLNDLEITVFGKSTKKEGKLTIEFKLYKHHGKGYGIGHGYGNGGHDNDCGDDDDDGCGNQQPDCIGPCYPIVIIQPPGCVDPCDPTPEPVPEPEPEPVPEDPCPDP